MLIERIMIITDAGLPIFDYIEYAKEDQVLLSGLLSALMSFASSTENEEISKVTFAQSMYIFKIVEKLIFAMKINDSMPDTYAEMILQQIVSSFLGIFGDEIKKFKGEVQQFDKFQEVCRRILYNMGLNIIERVLKEDTAEVRALVVFSYDNKQVFTSIISPNYPFQSFEIYGVIAKNFRKIIKKKWPKANKALGYLIAKNGFLVNITMLPYVTIVFETLLSIYKKDVWKKTKLMRQRDLQEFLTKNLKCNKADIYSTRLRNPVTDEEATQEQKELFNFFTANSTGIRYMAKSELILQVISIPQQSNLILVFPTRICFAEYQQALNIKDIYASFQDLK